MAYSEKNSRIKITAETLKIEAKHKRKLFIGIKKIS